jgi:hypothetical protein
MNFLFYWQRIAAQIQTRWEQPPPLPLHARLPGPKPGTRFAAMTKQLHRLEEENDTLRRAIAMELTGEFL